MPMANETVLVVGATGRFGSLVVPALKSRQLRVRVLARHSAKAEAALAGGADEAVLDDPQVKRDVENALYDSGLQYTVLRPAHASLERCAADLAAQLDGPVLSRRLRRFRPIFSCGLFSSWAVPAWFRGSLPCRTGSGSLLSGFW